MALSLILIYLAWFATKTIIKSSQMPPLPIISFKISLKMLNLQFYLNPEKHPSSLFYLLIYFYLCVNML